MNKNSPSVSALAGFVRTTPTALGMTNWDACGAGASYRCNRDEEPEISEIIVVDEPTRH